MINNDKPTYESAEQGKNEAIAAGFMASKEEWRAMALDVIHKVALAQPQLSVNDIRPQIDASKIKTRDTRALGGVMKAAQALGWIMPTGQFTGAYTGHLHPVSLWQSKIYKTPEQLAVTIYRYMVLMDNVPKTFNVPHPRLEEFLKKYPTAQKI